MKFFSTACVAVLLAGCTPATSPPTLPTPPTTSASPSPTCSPYNASPRPCSPQEQAETEELNALIAEAEKTYRTYWDESVRIQRVGGVTKATQPLTDTLTGEALKSVMETLQYLKENRTKASGGTIEIVSLTPKPTRTKDGSIMSLDVCWRGKGVKYKVDGVTLTRNATVREDSDLRG